MKPLVRLGYFAAVCALLVTTMAIIGPRAARAVVATFVQVVNTASQPALTGNVIDPYQQFADTDCTYAGDCQILFPTVTKEVLIRHASCEFELASSASVFFVNLGSQNDNSRQALQPFPPTTADGSKNYYAFNAETYLFVVAGDRPKIDVFANGAPVTGLFCTLSGNNIIHP